MSRYTRFMSIVPFNVAPPPCLTNNSNLSSAHSSCPDRRCTDLEMQWFFSASVYMKIYFYCLSSLVCVSSTCGSHRRDSVSINFRIGTNLFNSVENAAHFILHYFIFLCYSTQALHTWKSIFTWVLKATIYFFLWYSIFSSRSPADPVRQPWRLFSLIGAAGGGRCKQSRSKERSRCR